MKKRVALGLNTLVKNPIVKGFLNNLDILELELSFILFELFFNEDILCSYYKFIRFNNAYIKNNNCSFYFF